MHRFCSKGRQKQHASSFAISSVTVCGREIEREEKKVKKMVLSDLMPSSVFQKKNFHGGPKTIPQLFLNSLRGLK